MTIKPFLARLAPATLVAALSFAVLSGTSQPPAAPAASAPQVAITDRFISAESLAELALSFPKPPSEHVEFERSVSLLLKEHAADWPLAAQRAKESAPKDAYSLPGFDFLLLVDEALAAEVKAAAKPEAKAAACRARYPMTCAILDRATQDLIKSKYKPFPRPRPTGDRTDSYPSGHAALAVMQCRLLWEIIREQHPEAEVTLLNESYSRAVDRVVIAIHHPTDIAAGLAYGLAVSRRIIDQSPGFKAALETARKEW